MDNELDEKNGLQQALEAERAKRKEAQGQLKALQAELEIAKGAADKLKEFDGLQAKYKELESEHGGLKARFEHERALLKAGVQDEDVQEFALHKFGKSGEKDFGAWLGQQLEAKPTWLNASQQTTAISTPTATPEATTPRSPQHNGTVAQHIAPPPSQSNVAHLSATRESYAQNREIILQQLGFKP